MQHFLGDSKIEFEETSICIFQVTEYTPNFIDEKLTEFFNELGCAAKINKSLGIVFHDLVETQDYRYFSTADNNPNFNLPLRVANKEDLHKMKSKVQQEFFEQSVSHDPITKHKFSR